MIEEAYCSYEVSKLLKEKGFDEYCCIAYEKENLKSVTKIYDEKTLVVCNSECENDNIITSPTHQMAMRWLREEKDIIIVIQPEYFNVESICFAFGCDIWCNDNYEKLQGIFPSHEEAVEASLKYCLENLIKETER